MSLCQSEHLCIIAFLISFLFLFFFLQLKGDRYYLDGLIKVQKSVVDSLKGMNSNYLTSLKDFDYRFVSILLTSIFTKDELATGCVKIDSCGKPKEESHSSISTHKLLEERKIDFIKGKYYIHHCTSF